MTFTQPSPAPNPTDRWTTPPAPPSSGTPRPRRPVGLLAATAVLAALVGGGSGAGAAVLLADDQPAGTTFARDTAAATNSGTTVSQPAGSTAEVAARVLPSVVQIDVRSAGGAGSGSGVVLDGEGHILTNHHVVDAPGGQLRVTFQDGRRAAAEVVGSDPGADLAVIKVDGVTDLTPIAVGSSADLQVGETVLAVGSPLGLAGTVTEGIVSSKNRPVLTGGSEGPGAEPAVLNAIQTDTAINPGNSGGALVNLRGELVGINSAIATLGAGGPSGSIGLGFAIPVDQAARIAEELIRTGQSTRALLGAQVADALDGGALLASVQPDSAAERAGLRDGDVVTRLGDQIIGTGDALVAAVRSAEPGATVTLTVLRDGAERTVEVTLDSVPAS